MLYIVVKWGKSYCLFETNHTEWMEFIRCETVKRRFEVVPYQYDYMVMRMETIS